MSDVKLKRRLTAISDDIRTKHRALKLGIQEHDESLNKLFQPIVEPIKTVSMKLEKNQLQQQQQAFEQLLEQRRIHQEQQNQQRQHLDKLQQIQEQLPLLKEVLPTRSTTAKSETEFPEVFESNGQRRKSYGREGNRKDLLFQRHLPMSEEVFEAKPEETNEDDDKDDNDEGEKTNQQVKNEQFTEEVLNNFIEQFPDVAQLYVMQTLLQKGDTLFGPVINPATNTFYFGDSLLHINSNSDFTLNDKSFTGTEGLYQLLFNTPENIDKNIVTENDFHNYKQMLESANVYRAGTNLRKEKRTSLKFLDVIKPLFSNSPKKRKSPKKSTKLTPVRTRISTRSTTSSTSSKKGGGAYKISHNYPVEYVYWDDVNELVQRLNLLHAAKKAGSDCHLNEIRNIEEELRELHVIV
ncbi:hypothetical protein Zmor_000948 [Zophobas morio]|uniref:DUF8207 domain-containing protein n=1 Tax=Zophobas morio TaxID=2755281 RepID=A0AA38MS63_9CUCU|nr:hypothetical protein Zmor_000948 [Zophobas morio]